MQKNIAVFFGGMSCENEVSIITGIMTANLLKQSKELTVFPIYVSQKGQMYTGKQVLQIESYKTDDYLNFKEIVLQNGCLWYKKGRHFQQGEQIDAALNCCHGSGGEDGMISAILQVNHIANLSPAMLASSLCMDKRATKIFAEGLEIPTLPYIAVRERDFLLAKERVYQKVKEELGYPVIVKPNCLGSSIGIQVVLDRHKLEEACLQAFAYDSSIVIERYLPEKRELNCACYRGTQGLVVSLCEEPKSNASILTFTEKYLQNQKESRRVFPAEIDANLQKQVQNYTKKLYSKLDMCGVVRADFIVSGDKLFFNEMNTVPGSLAWYLFCNRLEDFQYILLDILKVAIDRQNRQDSKILLRNSGILECLPNPNGLKK